MTNDEHELVDDAVQLLTETLVSNKVHPKVARIAMRAWLFISDGESERREVSPEAVQQYVESMWWRTETRQ